MAKTYITLQTRVDQLKDRVNDITNLIGDLSRLSGKTGTYSFNGVGFDSAGVDPDTSSPTGKFKGDSDLSTAILETVYRLDSVDAIIDQDVRAIADVKFNSLHLGTYLDSANNLHINDSSIQRTTGGINIEAAANLVLDAGGGLIDLKDDSASRVRFNFTADSQEIDAVGNLTIDIEKNLLIDVDTGVIRFADGGTDRIVTNLGATNELDVTGNYTIDASGDITLDADGAQVNLADAGTNKVVFNFSADSQEIDITNNLTVDIGSNMIIDVDGGEVKLQDAGTQYGALTNNSGNLDIQSNNTLAARFTNDNVVFQGTVDATDSARMLDDFSVALTTNLGGTLNAHGATTLLSTVDVTDSANFSDNVSVNLALSAGGNVQFNGNLNVDGVTTLDSATVNGALAVTGSLGSLSVAQDADITGNLRVSDSSRISSNASISGNVIVGGTLQVDGVVTANAGVSIDNITIDGTEIDLSSGDLTVDVAGDIILDADGGDVFIKDAGTTLMTFQANEIDIASGNLTLDVPGDVTINADGGDITLADGATTFGRFTNNSGELQIKGGTTTAITLKGENAHFAGLVFIDSSMAATNGTLQNADYDATTVSGAIKTLDSDIGDLTELDATYYTGTERNNVLSALNTLASSVLLLDSASSTNIGALNNLTTTAKTNIVDAINEVNDRSTDSVSEGSTNLYFTTARARNSMVAGTAITYDSASGVMSISSNAITATQLNVDSNGSAGKALVSDGDGSFSFGHRPIAVFDSAGTLLN
jgi:cytoskeletal protein CcmA (bactofilin family)